MVCRRWRVREARRVSAGKRVRACRTATPHCRPVLPTRPCRPCVTMYRSPTRTDLAAQHATTAQHQDAWLRRKLGLIGLIDACSAQRSARHTHRSVQRGYAIAGGWYGKPARVARSFPYWPGRREANYIGGRRRGGRGHGTGAARGLVLGPRARRGLSLHGAGLARRADVAGYVRNLPDGRVHLVVEGDAQELDDFLMAIAQRMEEFIARRFAQDRRPATGTVCMDSRFATIRVWWSIWFPLSVGFAGPRRRIFRIRRTFGRSGTYDRIGKSASQRYREVDGKRWVNRWSWVF